MKIAVLFQVLPDISKALDADWSEDPRAPLRASLPRVLDTFDESALEMALRLRDALTTRGEAVSLHALTFGGEEGDRLVYARLFALGYDTVTRLGSGTGFYDPRDKARLLAAAVGSTDLLLAGVKSGLCGSGLCGYLTAGRLGLPVAADISSIEPAEGGALRVISEADGLCRRLLVRPPAALLIGNAENAYLRIPTLRARMAAGDRAPSILPAGPLAPRIPAAVRRPERRNICRFLTGDPASAAREILAWLAAEEETVSADMPAEAAPAGLRLYGGDAAALRAAAAEAEKTNAPLAVNVLRVEDGKLICPLYAAAIEAAYEPLPAMLCTLDRRSRLRATEAVPPAAGDAQIYEESAVRRAEAASLGSAPRVLAAGRGLGSADAVAAAQALAARLGLDFGATRPVVMNGWARVASQIGVSGALLHASRCLVLGASGAEAFLSAIPESCAVAAVNTDPEAPVFRAADIGYVGDAGALLRAMEDIQTCP